MRPVSNRLPPSLSERRSGLPMAWMQPASRSRNRSVRRHIRCLSVSRLQNSLTNLKTWKDKGTAAQTTCESQYEQCQKYNDELQALPDEPLSDVNTKFEEVKKTYKEAAYQEKQVRQTQQYVEVGRSELELTREILPAQEQDTEAGGQTGENAGT